MRAGIAVRHATRLDIVLPGVERFGTGAGGRVALLSGWRLNTGLFLMDSFKNAFRNQTCLQLMIHRQSFEVASRVAAARWRVVVPFCRFFTDCIRYRATLWPLSIRLIVLGQCFSGDGRAGRLIVNALGFRRKCRRYQVSCVQASRRTVWVS